jgi:hypothetical protein
MFKFAMKSKRFCRPLLGVVVAYAVAAQSLLFVLGGSRCRRRPTRARRLSSFVSTTAKPPRNCRPAIPLIPAARIASSVLPDRILL